MPAFSITAPEITADDERRERAALTDEERRRLHDDLSGTSTVVETEEMRTLAPALLQKAMLEIPVEEKAAYLEALERVPELVAMESPALAFMRFEGFNAPVSVNIFYSQKGTVSFSQAISFVIVDLCIYVSMYRRPQSV